MSNELEHLEKLGHGTNIHYSVHQDKGVSLSSLILGMAIGAAAALLFAPKKGEDFQKDLADSWGNAKNKLNDLKETIKSESVTKVNSAKEYLSDAKNALKAKADNFVDQVRHGFDQTLDAEDLTSASEETAVKDVY